MYGNICGLDSWEYAFTNALGLAGRFLLLQGCIITAPDYDSLQLVYTARRLWQSDDVMPPPEQKQDMNRRFAESYKILAQVMIARWSFRQISKKEGYLFTLVRGDSRLT